MQYLAVAPDFIFGYHSEQMHIDFSNAYTALQNLVEPEKEVPKFGNVAIVRFVRELTATYGQMSQSPDKFDVLEVERVRDELGVLRIHLRKNPFCGDCWQMQLADGPIVLEWPNRKLNTVEWVQRKFENMGGPPLNDQLALGQLGLQHRPAAIIPADQRSKSPAPSEGGSEMSSVETNAKDQRLKSGINLRRNSHVSLKEIQGHNLNKKADQNLTGNRSIAERPPLTPSSIPAPKTMKINDKKSSDQTSYHTNPVQKAVIGMNTKSMDVKGSDQTSIGGSQLEENLDEVVSQDCLDNLLRKEQLEEEFDQRVETLIKDHTEAVVKSQLKSMISDQIGSEEITANLESMVAGRVDSLINDRLDSLIKNRLEELLKESSTKNMFDSVINDKLETMIRNKFKDFQSADQHPIPLKGTNDNNFAQKDFEHFDNKINKTNAKNLGVKTEDEELKDKWNEVEDYLIDDYDCKLQTNDG